MHIRKSTQIIAGTLLCTMGLSACVNTGQGYQLDPNYQKTTAGAGLGALGGAVVGAISGDNAKERRKNALVGAGIGALAGGAVGNYMDRQEAAYRRQLANSQVEVRRQGNDILLNIPNNVTFAFDSSALQPQFHSTLVSIAQVMQEFPQTYVDVIGHTDSTGSDQYNMELSLRRSQSVGQFLMSQGVMAHRIMTRGMGETQPIASNESEAGRAQNRRVEIRISPIT